MLATEFLQLLQGECQCPAVRKLWGSQPVWPTAGHGQRFPNQSLPMTCSSHQETALLADVISPHPHFCISNSCNSSLSSFDLPTRALKSTLVASDISYWFLKSFCLPTLRCSNSPALELLDHLFSFYVPRLFSRHIFLIYKFVLQKK